MDAHTDLVERAQRIFKNYGYKVILEDKLPNGKGAPDVIATRGDYSNLVCEVKSSPISPNSKKILRQMKKYQDHYGSNYSYLLISPDAQDRVSVAVINGNYRGTLDDFLD